MKNYQKTKVFTIRLRPDQMDKLKKIAWVEMETSSSVLRKFIDKYELPKKKTKGGK